MKSIDSNGKNTAYELGDSTELERTIFAISYRKGHGYIRASRIVQRNSMEQYAVYIHDLGLEHNKYLSQKGQLLTGEIVWHKVANANPIQGLLSFTLASNKGSQTAYAA